MSYKSQKVYQRRWSNVGGQERVQEMAYETTPTDTRGYYRANGIEYLLHPLEGRDDLIQVDKYRDGKFTSSIVVSSEQVEQLIGRFSSQMFIGDFDTPLVVTGGRFGDLAREFEADLQAPSLSASLQHRQSHALDPGEYEYDEDEDDEPYYATASGHPQKGGDTSSQYGPKGDGIPDDNNNYEEYDAYEQHDDYGEYDDDAYEQYGDYGEYDEDGQYGEFHE